MSAGIHRTIIVDDEELARHALKSECARHGSINVIAECENGFEAVKAITDLQPDIVFLDIQMPKLSGFEVLELVQGDFAVVFVTAHDEFALKAFDANAIDYLLKPFSSDRFDKAVEKAMRTFASGTSREPREKARNIRPEGLAGRILVRDGNKVHVIPLAQVSHIEAQDDYIAIVVNGKRYLKQQRMTAIESRLPAERFVRVHRSTIMNLDFLARIEPYAKDSRVAILKDGTKVNVSRSGYERLKNFLGG